MGLLDYFSSQRKKNNASVAKERLQIVIAHERSRRSHAFLPKLQQELLDVIRKYIPIEDDQVKLDIERDGECEVLELNITLPEESARG